MLSFTGYVDKIKNLLFITSKEDRNRVKEKYKEKVPDPLNRQFPDRVPKEQAIENHGARKQLIAELFPAGTVHNSKYITTYDKVNQSLIWRAFDRLMQLKLRFNYTIHLWYQRRIFSITFFFQLKLASIAITFSCMSYTR